MRNVPITHRRVVTGQKPEYATIEVSDEAGAKYSLMKASGFDIHVRQLNPEEATKESEGSETAGVDQPEADPVVDGTRRLIAVSIEHRRGIYAREIGMNVAGSRDAQAITERLLMAVTKEELVKWVQTNA